MLWDIVIGLEVHAQLKTKSKLFSGSSTAYGALPNTQTSYLDAGYPGMLPVLNEQALLMAIQFGLVIGADINNSAIFERKNYFYPDLPKGYQISQLQQPLLANGTFNIQLKDGSLKEISILRAHLEEDAGKSVHSAHSGLSKIDLNRAGIPLLEIVTAPCLGSAEEVIAFLKKLQQLLRFLCISEANMQHGGFRTDVNLSLKPKGSTKLGKKTELKNLNSFRFIEQAIAFEFTRHQRLLENNQEIKQETRLYHPGNQTTYAMREKEFENDYRYFADPDLLPIHISRYQIAEIKSNLPELPDKIEDDLRKQPSLNEEDILFILSSPFIYQYYKDIKNLTKSSDKVIINWLKGPYTSALNEHHFSYENPPIKAETLAIFLDKIHNKSLSTPSAKKIFSILLTNDNKNIDELIQAQESNELQHGMTLDELIVQLLSQYPTQATELKMGKEKLMSFFIGKVMKQIQHQTNPQEIIALIKQHLEAQ